MKKQAVLLSIALIAVIGSTMPVQSSTTAINIQYGTVESAMTVEKGSKHAGGALIGGAMGALIGGRHHRGLKIATGAIAGSAIQGASTGGAAQQYTVKLNNGSSEIVTTEQVDIRQGDCVSIEKGQYANIRRVSSVHCQTNTSSPPEHHIAAASTCTTAKKELAAASTEDEVNIAVKKVKVLCED